MRTRDVLLGIVMAALASSPLSAQTEKGRIIADIDFALDYGTTEFDDSGLEVDHSLLAADIFLGYTVIDDLDIGIVVGADHSTMEVGSISEQSQKTRFYGVFGRYYLLEGQGLRPFLGAAGGLGSMETSATGAADTKHGLTFVSGFLGAAYFFNAHVGMELGGEYVVTSFSEDDANAMSDDMNATAFQLALGTVISF